MKFSDPPMIGVGNTTSFPGSAGGLAAMPSDSTTPAIRIDGALASAESSLTVALLEDPRPTPVVEDAVMFPLRS